jgi:hypothetical protein
MSSEGISAERLRAYLRELAPKAQALLMSELERGAMSGADVPGSDLILRTLRPVVRQSRSSVPRVGHPARLFFQPLEPFLVDIGSMRMLPGRLDRTVLEPLWQWLCRDAVPASAKTYIDEITAALVINDRAAAATLATSFQDEASRAIGDWLARGAQDDRLARRLAAQIGTPHALGDLATLHQVLLNRAALDQFSGRLPALIRNLSVDQIDNIVGLLRHGLTKQPEALQLGLIVVMMRIAPFWHLIRIAISAAESDIATRIEAVPHAVAIDIVLAELGRRIAELRVRLDARDFALAVASLRDMHDACRGLRSELDLSADTRWSRELSSLRSTISDLLQIEIEHVPGQLRRLLRPRAGVGAGGGERDGAAVLDATDVAEIEGRIMLADACRKYAGELAVNQTAPRVHAELKASLDNATPQLIDALRSAAPAGRRVIQSQVEAAARFAGKLYGAEYAALLVKAAGVAVGDRAAARA